jgi:hypothetical protein
MHQLLPSSAAAALLLCTGDISLINHQETGIAGRLQLRSQSSNHGNMTSSHSWLLHLLAASVDSTCWQHQLTPLVGSIS